MAETIEPIKKDFPAMKEVEDAALNFSNISPRIDGRILKRRSVGDDKVLNITNIPANSITTAMLQALAVTTAKIAAAAVTQSKLSYETASVTVSAGTASGTATVTSGSIILGFRPTGNQDQFIDNISVSGTTLTVTLAANATADNTFQVILLKS